MAIQKRRTEVIYYDCTNFYFEIEEAEDDKQFGVSKENKDGVEVVAEAMPSADHGTDPVQTEFVIDLLEEEVAAIEAALCIQGKVRCGTQFDVETGGIRFFSFVHKAHLFESEEAEDDKQFGVSKENRPLPIVEMGLFMDRDGIPLAFSINPGNESEQLSLIPLEKKLELSLDAG